MRFEISQGKGRHSPEEAGPFLFAADPDQVGLNPNSAICLLRSDSALAR